MKRILLSLAFLSLTSLGFAQKVRDFSAMPSMIKEAKEKGNIKKADSIAQDYINNYLFKLPKDDLFTKEYLDIIGEFFNNENSKAFKFFLKQSDKINSILGAHKAEDKIMDFIDKKYLPQEDFAKIKKPDWDILEKTVVAKFGALGSERVHGQRMIYYLVTEDWKNYGIWYQKYFEKALKHPKYHINNLSWALFEHEDNQSILSFACDVVMKYAIEEWYKYDWQSYDTYANLLYKTGKKDRAIEWEERALKLSGNDKSIQETLDKMKNNQKTWAEATGSL